MYPQAFEARVYHETLHIPAKHEQQQHPVFPLSPPKRECDRSLVYRRLLGCPWPFPPSGERRGWEGGGEKQVRDSRELCDKLYELRRSFLDSVKGRQKKKTTWLTYM